MGEWLLPNLAMATMAMDMVMAMDMAMVDMVMDTMDTMARDQLMLRLSLDMVTMAMDMDMVMAMDTAMVDMDMDTMVTTARDLLMLRPPLLPSQVMDTMDTTARDLLRLSQDMATTVMVMDMVMAMDTAMVVMVMDTTDKYLSFLLCSLEFSTNEIGPSFGTSHFQTIQNSSINYSLLKKK